MVWRCVAAFIAVVMGLVVAAPIASAKPSGEGIIEPDEAVSQTGKTYSEWSAAHWQYLLSIPQARSPAFDSTGARCGLQQSGPVFFLVGTFTTTTAKSGDVIGSATRTKCAIPQGKVLFFPVLNAECSTAEGNGKTEAELRACAQGFIDGARNLTAGVDGVSIKGLKHVKNTDFRAESPLFTFAIIKDNILNIPPDTKPSPTPSVADGVYLMLAPLASGQHTIHLHGDAPLSPPAPSPRFFLDVTYSPLTVG
jgi:hypothetical protein